MAEKPWFSHHAEASAFLHSDDGLGRSIAKDRSDNRSSSNPVYQSIDQDPALVTSLASKSAANMSCAILHQGRRSGEHRLG